MFTNLLVAVTVVVAASFCSAHKTVGSEVDNTCALTSAPCHQSTFQLLPGQSAKDACMNWNALCVGYEKSEGRETMSHGCENLTPAESFTTLKLHCTQTITLGDGVAYYHSLTSLVASLDQRFIPVSPESVETCTANGKAQGPWCESTSSDSLIHPIKLDSTTTKAARRLESRDPRKHRHTLLARALIAAAQSKAEASKPESIDTLTQRHVLLARALTKAAQAKEALAKRSLLLSTLSDDEGCEEQEEEVVKSAPAQAHVSSAAEQYKQGKDVKNTCKGDQEKPCSALTYMINGQQSLNSICQRYAETCSNISKQAGANMNSQCYQQQSKHNKDFTLVRASCTQTRKGDDGQNFYLSYTSIVGSTMKDVMDRVTRQQNQCGGGSQEKGGWCKKQTNNIKTHRIVTA